MSTKFIRLADVLVRYSLSKSTIYGLISKGEFPAPVHLGRSSLWSVDQLNSYDYAKLSSYGDEMATSFHLNDVAT